MILSGKWQRGDGCCMVECKETEMQESKNSIFEFFCMFLGQFSTKNSTISCFLVLAG